MKLYYFAGACSLADHIVLEWLLGDGSLSGRAEVMQWLGFLNSDVHPAFKPIFAPSRFLPDPSLAGSVADTARGHVRTYLGRIDKRLEGREWLTDERSVADAYLFVLLRWAVRGGQVRRPSRRPRPRLLPAGRRPARRQPGGPLRRPQDRPPGAPHPARPRRR